MTRAVFSLSFNPFSKIENWVGCVGMGVCGGGDEYIDTPAISAMIGSLPKDYFQIFPPAKLDKDDARKILNPWLKKNDPMLIFIHGDPTIKGSPDRTISALEQQSGGFLVGGLSSSRGENIQIAHNVVNGGFSGVAFSDNIEVATALTQGCKPIGISHTITKGAGNVIFELDDQPAAEAFEADLKSMIINKIDMNPDEIRVNEETMRNPSAMPAKFQSLLQGEIDIAFPIPQSDQNDYLVRNITNMNNDDGSIAISDVVKQGETVQFVHREAETITKDLSKKMVALRERITRERGEFKPKAALYVSCVVRAFTNFTNDEDVQAGGEMALIGDIIGDVPIAGFYASGEISNARFYGYTGILTLFL